jgi:DNA helicase-2/ATP-dependent DNA helicase PcrA
MERMSVEAPTSRDELIGDLDDEQREAVLAARGPVCVLAGAGTGKTRTITRRIAHLVAAGHVAPHQVLAVTFTQRAAGEMHARLRAFDNGVGTGSVQAVTFHAAARRQLSYFWPQTMGGQMPRLLDSKAKALAHAAESLRLKIDTAALRDLAAEIEWRKVSRLTLEDYAKALPGRSLPPSISVEKAVDMSTAWGSELHLAGEAGHINVASGHGPWPEGLLMFTRLMQRLKA